MRGADVESWLTRRADVVEGWLMPQIFWELANGQDGPG